MYPESSLWRLKELNAVARWIIKKDLLTTVSYNYVIPKMRSRIAQRLDLRSKIFKFDLDAIPATRCGFTSIRHGLSRASSAWRVQKETKIASR